MLTGDRELSLVIEWDELGLTALSVNVNNDGFYLILNVQGQESRLFNWTEVVQILIDLEPDMFGDLNDPDTWVFASWMEYLGFQIPSWRIREIEAMFGKSWHKLVKRHRNQYWPERRNVRSEQ